MAKVVITIQDLPDGKVNVVVNPSCEEMLQKLKQGSSDLTAAEGYAFTAANAISMAAKTLEKNRLEKMGIIVPDFRNLL